MFKKERIIAIAGGAATFAVWFITGLVNLYRGTVTSFSYAFMWAMLLTFIFLYYRRVLHSLEVLEDEIERARETVTALEALHGKLEAIRRAKEEQEKDA